MAETRGASGGSLAEPIFCIQASKSLSEMPSASAIFEAGRRALPISAIFSSCLIVGIQTVMPPFALLKFQTCADEMRAVRIDELFRFCRNPAALSSVSLPNTPRLNVAILAAAIARWLVPCRLPTRRLQIMCGFCSRDDRVYRYIQRVIGGWIFRHHTDLHHADASLDFASHGSIKRPAGVLRLDARSAFMPPRLALGMS